MANIILKSNNQSTAFHVLGLFCFMLVMQKGSAREFAIGGSGKWTVPDSTTSYNQWAENSRFQIGDSIVFNYPSGQDSVFYVTNDAYNNCTTDAPIESFTDGHTVFTFNHSGPFYFISGNKDNCIKNEKLVVVVLADRSNQTSNATALSPPSPAPASMESPPAGTVEVNPTPAPVGQESPPPAGAASTIFMSSIGSIGAFVASSLILVF